VLDGHETKEHETVQGLRHITTRMLIFLQSVAGTKERAGEEGGRGGGRGEGGRLVLERLQQNFHGRIFGVWCVALRKFQGCDPERPNVSLCIVPIYLFHNLQRKRHGETI
jgi:hypothetical protein